MKVESYLIASTVNIAIGQRLVRRICPNCKTARKITASEIKSLSHVIRPEILEQQKEFYYGKGCKQCANSGYYGRIGIHEVLVPDTTIRDAVPNKEPAAVLKKYCLQAWHDYHC